MTLNQFSAATFGESISDILADFYKSKEPLFAQISTDSQQILETLRTYTSAGKRFRAQFAYWGYRSTDSNDDAAVLRACASLELLQACALIHDDVMDGSDTRRGKPSTHREFENWHAASNLNGNAEAFGVGAAILIGDLALSWADELLLSSPVATALLTQTKSLYDTMRTELMAGQFLDLLIQQKSAPTISEIKNVMRYKSAKYTIERPLHLGATLGGATSTTLEALSGYGLALGEAFQLRDDILGVFGDSAITGKPVGDDLREGKQTLLIAYAREALSPAEYKQLSTHLGRPDLSPIDVAECQNLLQNSGALERAEADIENLRSEALTRLNESTINHEAVTALTKLVDLATERRV